jgi:RimJ/RimL family protein N-acetyltransferase
MNQTPIPTEITFVDFKCPYCENPVSFPNQFIGRAQECPNCSQILVVPKPGKEVGAKLPIPFKTSRLLIRRLDPIDSNDILEIVSDEEMLRYQDWYPMDELQLQTWLADDQKTQLFQLGSTFYLALELLEQTKVIGFLTLTMLEKENLETSVSIDVLVNQKYQRRGFGLEAFRGAMEFIFAGLNVRRLCCWCDSRNLDGVRLFEKAGLRREGHFVKCKFIKGEWVDSVQYSLLQEEYGSVV